jgi:hypothetical protein
MLGNNLSRGDAIIGTTSSSESARALAWTRDGELNTLLIYNVDEQRIVRIEDLDGEVKLLKIENNIPWETPATQTNAINSNVPLVMNGYAVALSQG